MLFKVIIFITAILALYLHPAPPHLIAVLPLLAIVLLIRRLRPLAFACLGLVWATVQLEWTQAHGLRALLDGSTVLVEGLVLERPAVYEGKRVRMLFGLQRLLQDGDWRVIDTRVRLDWYGAQSVPAPGDRWRLAVRLKPPSGYANPGGFDYERWLFRERIRATGYVHEDGRNQFLGEVSRTWMARLRDRLATSMETRIPVQPSMALIEALTVGERAHIDHAQWAVLRATGTSHLMAISGLHISLVAALAFGLVRWFWARYAGLSLRLQPRHAAAFAALVGAMLYAQLSGFAVPAQRAFIMVALVMLAVISGRRATFARIIGLAALATVLIDPAAVLSPGWWLSFGAVAVIAWFSVGRSITGSNIRRWVLMPLLLAFCLAPLLLLFFQEVSLVAPLANIVAVPWVSFLVVPAALAGTALWMVSEAAGLAVMGFAALMLEILWQGLQWLAASGIALAGMPQPQAWQLLAAVAGMAVLCVPRGIPGRWCGGVLLLPLLFMAREQPLPGEAWLTVLDVGQGLAAVVRTTNHTLVFDTGPSFGEDFDTGSAVVIPYLRSQGVRSIDRLLISHGDNDHIGGARSVLRRIPVAAIMSGVPVAAAPDRLVEACRRGRKWSWDGVMFSILHPLEDGQDAGNNGSCVLQVVVRGGQALLLTGDIERTAEYALVDTYGDDLTSAVLVVPHHGSMTSSTPAFINAVKPRLALVPAGYRNRYRFPHPDIIRRYRERGARLLTTGDSGAVSVRLSPGAARPVVSRYRLEASRLWRRRGDDG